MALVYQAAGRRETRITGLTAQGMHLHGRIWPSIGAGGDLSDLAGMRAATIAQHRWNVPCRPAPDRGGKIRNNQRSSE
jgi:hypothetical protein